jgi:anti-sigma regulatory factor (Ser/Thr protein kinase)
MEPDQFCLLDKDPDFIMRTAIFKANFKNLDSIREYVARAAKDAGFDEAGVYAIQLAADEASSNIIEHAYRDEEDGDIECTCSLEGNHLVLVFRDHGLSYEPESIPEPNLSGKLSKRQIGGLGLYLIRKLMDEVHYESFDKAGNVLTLKKHIAG